MRRDEALAVLRRSIRRADIVVAVYQALFDWLALGPRDLDYVSTGAMGQASTHGLGLALACPERRVIVFDGDGSLLMNLGSLATVADARPANFWHFVFFNGTYEVNGAHPIPAARHVDFPAMALACGYRGAFQFDDVDRLEAGLPAALAASGPLLIELRVEPGKVSPRDYEYIHSAEARSRFRKALNSGVVTDRPSPR
ncbi:MAG: thiamine pyrophosphate-dependent enzyme [Rhodobacteraceae bacterium]|nr:thiamine pyrophosphate-dependent enzyme [Paracoccaceae bacterium]